MNEYRYKSDDLAAEFSVHRKTILRWTKEFGLGIDLGGRAGYRYSDRDRALLIESFKTDTPTPRRRKRAA